VIVDRVILEVVGGEWVGPLEITFSYGPIPVGVVRDPRSWFFEEDLEYKTLVLATSATIRWSGVGDIPGQRVRFIGRNLLGQPVERLVTLGRRPPEIPEITAAVDLFDPWDLAPPIAGAGGVVAGVAAITKLLEMW